MKELQILQSTPPPIRPTTPEEEQPSATVPTGIVWELYTA